ncbi:MAG: hypothetical protein II850_09815 [Fibrobacter sp.]|nr:hypothetical protein [Fibrobacter sp.]
MKKSIVILLFAMAFVAFYACESTESVTNVQRNVGADVLDEGEKIKDVKCDSSVMGKIVYDRDFGVPMYCNGSGWTMLNGRDGKDGKDGKDGADGKDGKDGKDGENGWFCVVETRTSNSFFLNCDGDTVTVSLDWEIDEGCHIVSQDTNLVRVACDGDTLDVPYGIKGPKGPDATLPDSLRSESEEIENP